MTRREIVFEKWKDPTVTADQWDEAYPADEGGDEYDQVRTQFKDFDRPRFNPYKGPYFIGPAGIIPLSEHNLPGKVFNFWLGHTNFDIKPEDRDLLDRVKGVEVLRVFTRYRFWFAVGRRFNDEEVRRAIEGVLCPSPPPPPADRPDAATSLRKTAEAKWKYWAILRLPPRGRLECIGEDDEARAKVRAENLLGVEGAELVACSWGKGEADDRDGS